MSTQTPTPAAGARAIRLAILLGATALTAAPAAAPAAASTPSWRPGMPPPIRSWREEILDSSLYTERLAAWRAYLDAHATSGLAHAEVARAMRYAREGTPEERRALLEAGYRTDPECPELLVELASGAHGESVSDTAFVDSVSALAVRAAELAPEWPEPYFTIWSNAAVRGAWPRAHEALAGLVRTEAFPSPLLDFAYNLLVSAGPNGIILTNGDNDTYPLLALQTVHDTRPDVAVVNVHLLNVPAYARGVFAAAQPGRPALGTHEVDARIEAWTADPGDHTLADVVIGALLDKRARGEIGPLYFATTVAPKRLEKVTRELEIEGLLLRVGERPAATGAGGEDLRPIDRIRTERLFDEAFRLESATDLAYPWRPESAISRLMWNYPAVLKYLMAAHLEAGDEASARHAAERALGLLAFHTELGEERDEVMSELVRYWEARVPGTPLTVPGGPATGGS